MKKPIDIKLTRAAFEKLQEELKALGEKRPGVVVRLTAAREQGDLSENAGYHAAKEELGYVDSRIRELKLLIRFADVVENSYLDIISVGSKVRIDDGAGVREFLIVGQLEADPLAGKMSNVSPIGSALLGKRAGEAVSIDVPDGKVEYKIIEVLRS